MSRRRFLDAAVVTGCVLLLLGYAIDVLVVLRGETNANVRSDLALLPVGVTLAVLGPLIVRRRPGNPIGVLFSSVVPVAGVIVLSDAYAAAGASGGEYSTLERASAWVASVAWIAVVVPLLALLPLWFPNGDLLSSRWRWAVRLVVLDMILLGVGLTFAPGKLDGYPIDNPLAVPPGALFDGLALVGYLLLIVGILLGAVALALRFRRSRGLERQQVKWVALGGGIAAAAFVLNLALGLLGGIDAGSVTTVVSVTAVVLTAGLAVLRYRLYDVDRLITRTLSYAVLTTLMGTAYVGLVLAGQAVFSSFAGGSHLAIAVSTLVVAALFLPLRARIQCVVDRRFNRRRYDAERTLAAFGARLREQLELETLSAEMVGVVTETMQPARAALWLRDPA